MTMLLESFNTLLEANRGRPGASSARAFVPATDLLVGEDEVRLVMDVPGFKTDDLEIELADGVLSVRGERRYPYHEDQAHKLNRLERGYGRFERLLQVPKGVEPDALSASMSDGVLTLSIPLPKARRPHRIEIAGGVSSIETTARQERDAEESVAENDGHRELTGSAA
ncbi:MAG TPA: HSP20 family small heat-shock protein [Solirubrobacterales bacterium]